VSLAIPDKIIPANTLTQHVSWARYKTCPLYFGRGAANRYDAPDNSYGVLYLGQDLSTALMESVFHKHQWATVKKRALSQIEVDQRMVRFVDVQADLRLADLTAPNVVASQFGLNLAQLASRKVRATAEDVQDRPRSARRSRSGQVRRDLLPLAQQSGRFVHRAV
jgi:hypothetical protein